MDRATHAQREEDQPERTRHTKDRQATGRPETRYGPGVIEDPFDGFFDDHLDGRAPAGALLDIAPAKRWFDVIRWGIRTRLYSYQQVMRRLDGAHVSLHGRVLTMLSSYDYLDLIGHPAIDAAAAAAIHEYGTGTGGVRLLTGTCLLHRDLEADLAAFKGTEAAIALGSGYAANVGVIAALFGPNDAVIADEAIHRSLVDGCLLARVPVRFFSHNDLTSLRRALQATGSIRRRLIAVEGVYSMDGDVCPLPGIVALKSEHGAFLLVDEAHALGVLGEGGLGIHEHFGLPATCAEIWTGSLSKAIPASGGYVAGSRALIFYLQHGMAPFMFSAALSPASAAAARAAIAAIGREPGRLARLRRNAARLREGLASQGWDVGLSTTALIPVLLGDDAQAYTLARRLLDEGIFTTAIVPPAVPRGGARLRLCATAALTDDDLEEALRAFRAVRP